MIKLVIFSAIFAIAIFLEQAWRIEDDRRLQKQIDELRKEIEKDKEETNNGKH